MRVRVIGSVVALSLATSACVIRTGTGNTAAAPPPAPAPAPAPAPPRNVATPAIVAPPPAPAPAVAAPPRLVHVPGSLANVSAPPKIVSPIRFGTPDERGALRGLVYFIPEGTPRLPDFGAMAPQATLYTDVINVPLSDFNEGFPGVTNRVEWFGIRYEGKFNVSRAGNWFFKVVSDDGSRVYIDGQPVLDNDGIHTPRNVSTTIALAAGPHTLRVDYFQAIRWAVQLQLWVMGPGETQERPWGPNL